MKNLISLKSSTKLALGLITILSFSSFSMGQGAPPPPPNQQNDGNPATGNANQGNKNELSPEELGKKFIAENTPLPAGVRFVFTQIPDSCRNGIYMPINKETVIQIPPSMGLLSKRFAFPAGKNLMFLDSKPVNGKITGNKLLTSKIPDEYKKAIAVIVPTADGLGSFYIDEDTLKPGTIYIKNLTNQRLGFTLHNKDVVNLAPGETHILADQPKGKSIPAKLFAQNKDGKWLGTRMFGVLPRSNDAEVTLLVWNPSLNRPDIQKIVVAPQRFKFHQEDPNSPDKGPSKPEKRVRITEDGKPILDGQPAPRPGSN